MRLRVIGKTFFSNKVTQLEATPSGIRRADVKWLTPEASRLCAVVGGRDRGGRASVRWKRERVRLTEVGRAGAASG